MLPLAPVTAIRMPPRCPPAERSHVPAQSLVLAQQIDRRLPASHSASWNQV